jgi:PAS domain S-box-containing protein
VHAVNLHPVTILAPLVGRAANPMAVVDADGAVVVENEAFETLADRELVLADPVGAGASVDPVAGAPELRLVSLDRRALPRPAAPGEADLRRVLDTLRSFVCLMSADGVILDVNTAPLVTLDLRREDLVGRPISSLALWDANPGSLEVLQEGLAKAARGTATRGDLRLRTPRGQAMILDVQVVPVRDEHGAVRRVVASGIDVTERRGIEADLRDREERFRATFDVAAVGLAHVAPDGRWLRVNEALCRILGYSREQLLGMRTTDVTHPDDIALGEEIARRMVAGEIDSHRMEKRYVRADGGVVWAELEVSVVGGADGSPSYFVSAIRDLTSRRESEALVRRQLAEIETLYRTNPVGLGVLDADLRFARINERLADMNGLPVEAHIGRSIREIVPGLADAAEPVLRRILETGEPVVGIEVTGQTVAQPGVERTWIETWMPVRSSNDEIVGISITAEEVTERRKVERLRDTFIGMLSHELRTPITSLYAASQLLLRSRAASSSERDRELVAEVAAGAEGLQRIVENLLVLARVERGVALPGSEPVLLQRLLPTVLDAERRLWPEHRIEACGMATDLPPVRSDEDALVQVVRNLVSNAAKYGGTKGEIRVSVTGPEDEMVTLRVTDEGPGLGEDVDPERVFDLYYRAADAQRRAAGAGIGLFVSRALVDAMGGTLSAANRPEGGAQFTVSLPVFTEG